MGNTHPTKKYDSLSLYERSRLHCNKCMKYFPDVKYACKVPVMKEDPEVSTSVKLYYFHSKEETELKIIDARRSNKFHVWKIQKGRPIALLFRVGKYHYYCTRCMITAHKDVLDKLCADLTENVYIVDLERKYVFNALPLNTGSRLSEKPTLECIQCKTKFTFLKYVGYTRIVSDVSQQDIPCQYYYRFSPCENLAVVGLTERLAQHSPGKTLKPDNKEPTAEVPTNVPLLGLIVINNEMKCFKCVSDWGIYRFLQAVGDRVFLITKTEGREVLHFIKNSPHSPNLHVPGPQQLFESSTLVAGMPLPCVYHANARYADPSMNKYDPMPANYLRDDETGDEIISPRSANRTTSPSVLADESISYAVQPRSLEPITEEGSKLSLRSGTSDVDTLSSTGSRTPLINLTTRSKGDAVPNQPTKTCDCPGACGCRS